MKFIGRESRLRPSHSMKSNKSGEKKIQKRKKIQKIYLKRKIQIFFVKLKNKKFPKATVPFLVHFNGGIPPLKPRGKTPKKPPYKTSSEKTPKAQDQKAFILFSALSLSLSLSLSLEPHPQHTKHQHIHAFKRTHHRNTNTQTHTHKCSYERTVYEHCYSIFFFLPSPSSSLFLPSPSSSISLPSPSSSLSPLPLLFFSLSSPSSLVSFIPSL